MLGVTALIQPIHVSRGLLRQEIPVMGLALIVASGKQMATYRERTVWFYW